MFKHRSILRLTLTLCSLFVMVGVTQSSFAQDFSSETYNVQFMPWANQKVALRTTDGRWIGYTQGDFTLQTAFDGNSFRSSVTTGGIDLGTLFQNYKPVQLADGHWYINMKITGKDITLDDNRVLSASTETQSNEVMIDLADLQISRILQPVSSTPAQPDAPAPQVAASQRFNDTSNGTGVTPPTQPDATASIPAPAPPADEDDEADDDPETMPGGYTNMRLLPNGGSFQAQILSSPICSNGSTNTPSSDFGPRGRPDRRGICHARNGAKMSCNHMGIDIAARRGTPVLASAYGCFLAPGRAQKPTGTPITGADLRLLKGYGNTLRLYHGNGLVTQYSHLTSVSGKAQWGKCVQRGDVIGYTGNTGQSSGPHLHFGVYQQTSKGLKAVNPKTRLISTAGSFFNPSCRAVPRYPDLDAGMRNSGRGGTPAVRTSSGGRAVR